MLGRCKHIGTIFILLIVFGSACTGAFAEEPETVIIRASIVPADGVWVGQRVLYQVDVLGLNGWANIQRMPDVQISGAMVVALQSQGVRLNETIGGEAYTGQRYQLSLFPQRSGPITIPPISLDIEISQWGSQSKKRAIEGATPSVEFMAQRPPGSEKVPWLISTAQLTAEQRWDPDVDKVAVGEAVKRTVELSAEDISAMVFTPISFVGNDKFDVYPRAPEVEDRYNRGTLTGQRTESVTYLFKKAGSVELPAITITWWDLQNNKLRETVLPSRSIDIRPSAAGDGGISATATPEEKFKSWIALLLTLPVVLAVLFRKHLRAQWTAWQRKRRDSEHRYYRRFVKAARSGHAAKTFNALMRWLDRIETHGRSAQLDQFISTYADARTAEEADRLCRAVAAEDSPHWQGRDLIKGFVRARRNWIAQQHPSERSDRLLPSLNPGHD
jgi:hypothetical protein